MRLPSKIRPSRDRRTVVFVTFETEFARSGGLGAVMAVLPKQMAQYETCFVLGPHFGSITDLDRLVKAGRIEAFSVVSSFDLPVEGKTYAIDVTEVTGPDRFKTYLLSADGFFTAPTDPYLNPRDPASSMDPDMNPNVPEKLVEDVLFFCAAVPRALVELGMTRDLVLQLQDWETACVTQAVRLDPDVESVACVLTVHNPYDQYLGDVGSKLTADLLAHLHLRRDNVLTQMIPLVDGPLSTVSQNFARELTGDPLHTHVFANHVQALLVEKGLVGIDNGVFGRVVFPFSPQAEEEAKKGDFQRVEGEKWERREKLAEVIEQYQRELAQVSDPGRQAWGADLDLSDPRLPVFLVMGRDDPRQKGFDVIAQAIRRIPEGAARYIFTPMPGAEGLVGLSFLKRLADERPGEVKVFPFRLSFEAFQALQNGSSYMVMGSLYEPFGAANEAYLAGMSVVARATGGLVQQVVPYSQAGLSPYGRQLAASFHDEDAAPTGFLFREPALRDETEGWRRIVDCAYWDRVPRGDRIADDREEIPLFDGMVQSAAEALQAAIDLYTTDQAAYAQLIYNGFRMLERFGWDRAIAGYRRLYDQVCD
jgi:glycogen synthase